MARSGVDKGIVVDLWVYISGGVLCIIFIMRHVSFSPHNFAMGIYRRCVNYVVYLTYQKYPDMAGGLRGLIFSSGVSCLITWRCCAMQNLGTRLLTMCSVGKRLKVWLDGIRATVVGNRTAVVELIDGHESLKVVVDELKTWAETLATKLNSDGGVTDENYDATIAASAPDTLSAGDPAEAPAVLEVFE